MITVTILPVSKYRVTFSKFAQEYVLLTRSLQGARFHPTTRDWTADRSYSNALILYRNGIFADREILDKLEGKVVDEVKSEDYAWTIKLPPKDYQITKVQKLNRPKMLLRGDMGVGKTFMAMLWMASRNIDPKNVLIICPPTLIPNWERELFKFTGEKSIMIQGTTTQRLKAFTQEGCHIVNYDYLVSNKELRAEFAQLKNKTTLICDESHKIKNPMAQRSKVLHKFAQKFTNELLMTGTPVSQGAQDYYSQFKCIDPALLGSSFSAFKSRFCVLEQIRGAPPGASKIVGYKNLEDLNRIIGPYIVDVTKEECLDLPPKTYTTRYVTMSPQQTRDYKNLKTQMALWVGGRSEDTTPVTATNILTRLLRLSQITQGFIPDSDDDKTSIFYYPENPKLDALMELIEDDVAPKDSLVVICRFKADIATLRQTFEKNKISFAVIDGSVEASDRFKIAEEFQQGKYKVLIGQIQTVGLGLNLDKANTVVFYSNNYSLVDRLQAEDRIHRATTTHTKCTYIDIVAAGTVDEDVIDAIRNKKDVSQMLAQMRLDTQ